MQKHNKTLLKRGIEEDAVSEKDKEEIPWEDTSFVVPCQEQDKLSHGVLCALELLKDPPEFGKLITSHKKIRVCNLLQKLRLFKEELRQAASSLTDKELEYTCNSQCNGIDEALEQLSDDSVVEYVRIASRKKCKPRAHKSKKMQDKAKLSKEKDLAPVPFENIPAPSPLEDEEAEEKEEEEEQEQEEEEEEEEEEEKKKKKQNNSWHRPWEVFDDCLFPPDTNKDLEMKKPQQGRPGLEIAPEPESEPDSEAESNKKPSRSKSKSKFEQKKRQR
ncbi:hypothetical protein RFI_18895 [Reticulomyxa filosa]|uniref:Uncharacterized protein n=1 Tax=Reticulomyxa filosa TaxID=46433 RepID=X6MZB0_RETFI|nr:hypothetical protein RFI_18895 [Reticulomyxa filosa]|eukprot:ETO18375.1 hypothetical protein RFI_18895 [Reticulomyxa filosa]